MVNRRNPFYLFSSSHQVPHAALCELGERNQGLQNLSPEQYGSAEQCYSRSRQAFLGGLFQRDINEARGGSAEARMDKSAENLVHSEPNQTS